MLRILRNKSLWALAIPLVVCGSAYAGGAHCNHDGKVAAAHDESDNGSHCNLAKSVTKTSKMTKDGAVVTLVGKTDEAVAHIKEHLATHEKGGDCPDCPFNMDGVTSTFKITDKGGEVTMTGANPEAVKKVQEWARKPAGDCCGKAKSA